MSRSVPIRGYMSGALVQNVSVRIWVVLSVLLFVDPFWKLMCLSAVTVRGRT